MVAVAVSLVLAQVLVEPGGELAAERVVDQGHAEVVRVAARKRGVDAADDGLGRAGPVNQVDGGAF